MRRNSCLTQGNSRRGPLFLARIALVIICSEEIEAAISCPLSLKNISPARKAKEADFHRTNNEK